MSPVTPSLDASSRTSFDTPLGGGGGNILTLAMHGFPLNGLVLGGGAETLIVGWEEMREKVIS